MASHPYVAQQQGHQRLLPLSGLHRRGKTVATHQIIIPCPQPYRGPSLTPSSPPQLAGPTLSTPARKAHNKGSRRCRLSAPVAAADISPAIVAAGRAADDVAATAQSLSSLSRCTPSNGSAQWRRRNRCLFSAASPTTHTTNPSSLAGCTCARLTDEAAVRIPSSVDSFSGSAASAARLEEEYRRSVFQRPQTQEDNRHERQENTQWQQTGVQGQEQRGADGDTGAQSNSYEEEQSARLKLQVLLSLAFVICNMDKVNLSIAIIPMAEDLGWSAATQGLVASSFFWGYVLTQLPGGWLSRSLGGEKLLQGGVMLWSVATMAAPLAAASGSVPALLLSRFLVGLGEGLSPAAATDIIARRFPAEERSRAVAVVFGGLNVGSVAGLVLSPLVVEAYGWPCVFTVFGALGILWCAAYSILAPNHGAATKGSLNAHPQRTGKGMWQGLLHRVRGDTTTPDVFSNSRLTELMHDSATKHAAERSQASETGVFTSFAAGVGSSVFADSSSGSSGGGVAAAGLRTREGQMRRLAHVAAATAASSPLYLPLSRSLVWGSSTTTHGSSRGGSNSPHRSSRWAASSIPEGINLVPADLRHGGADRGADAYVTRARPVKVAAAIAARATTADAMAGLRNVQVETEEPLWPWWRFLGDASSTSSSSSPSSSSSDAVKSTFSACSSPYRRSLDPSDDLDAESAARIHRSTGPSLLDSRPMSAPTTPVRVPGASSAQTGPAAGEGTQCGIPWRAMLGSSSVRALAAAHFCHDWGKYSLQAWLPAYYSSQLHLSLTQASLVALAPPLGSIAVGAAAGWLADWMLARGTPPTLVRRVFQVTAFVSPALAMAAVWLLLWEQEQPTLTIALLSGGLALSSSALAGLYCSHQDISPKYAAMLLGLTNTAGAMPGFLGVSLTGLLYSCTHSWDLALFAPSMAVLLVGAAVWCHGVRNEPIDFDAEEKALAQSC